MIMKIVFINIMRHFYHQTIMKMYLPDQNIIQQNEEYTAITGLLWIYYNKNKRGFNVRYHCYFLLSMTPNCHHIWLRSVNTLIPQITKFIPMIGWGKLLLISVVRGAKKNNSQAISIRFKNILMGIVDTAEKDVSNVHRKTDKRKICTLLLNSSSTIISCTIREMYNRVHCAQNERLVLKSFFL